MRVDDGSQSGDIEYVCTRSELAGGSFQMSGGLRPSAIGRVKHQHTWSKWRAWRLSSEGARWYWTEPQVRECTICGLKQRYWWWRR